MMVSINRSNPLPLVDESNFDTIDSLMAQEEANEAPLSLDDEIKLYEDYLALAKALGAPREVLDQIQQVRLVRWS